MTVSTKTGIGMVRKGVVFTNTGADAVAFHSGMIERRLQPIVATPRADLLDEFARAGEQGKSRLPIAEVVTSVRGNPAHRRYGAGTPDGGQSGGVDRMTA